MEWFLQNLIPLLSIVATSIVGIILGKLIQSQKDTISAMKTNMDTMKLLNDMYNPDKMKSYSDLVEKEAEMRYKSHFKKQLNIKIQSFESIQSALNESLDLNYKIFDLYQELAQIAVVYLVNIPQQQRVEIFNKYPKNEAFLKNILAEIDKRIMTKEKAN